MQWVETTAATVEEAKELALDQLGIAAVDAEFEILEEPRSGLFGLRRSEARVRARVRPTQPRAKEERRRRRGGRTGGDGGDGGDGAAGGGAGDGRGPSGPAERGRRRAPRQQAGGDDSIDDEESTDVTDDVAIAEQGERARAFVAGVLERFGVAASVDVRELDEETVEVGVRGDDLGLLIGPKGATLAALQELARTVVQRQTGARNGRIVVDVAGYRQRRRGALERFTRQVAQEVLSSGTRRALEPMTPADRKVVHDTANQIDGVRTASEGEEPRRRVVLLPDDGA